MTLKQIQLADGRSLGWAEFGDPDGHAVLAFHGFPGSRLDGELSHEVALKVGARIICIDRPGYGASDFKAGRRIIDWPGDVAEFADALGLGKFAVMGASGGGPYAAACACSIPGRLSSAAVVCGMAPLNVPGVMDGMGTRNRIIFGVSRWLPGLVGIAMQRLSRKAKSDPEGVLQAFAESMPEVDKQAMLQPDMGIIFMRSFEEAGRQGRRAISQEAGLYAKHWGFEVADISMQVHVYHGGLDQNVPPAMGHYLAEAIPNSVMHFYPEDGHLSLIANHQEAILSSLLEP